MVLFVEKPVGVQCTHDEARDDDNDEIKVSSSSTNDTLLIGTCIEKAKPISTKEAGIIFMSDNNETHYHINNSIEQPSSTNHQSIESERIDVCKFILILLVVIGHFIEPYSKVGNTTATTIMHIIYSFHVPAFVCISGYCTSSLDSKMRRRKMISSLLIPYLTLQLLFCTWYEYIVKHRQNNTIDEDIEDESMMFTPNWSLYNQQPWSLTYPFAHLWYLVSLLTMRIWRPFALEIRYTIPVHVLLGCIIGYSTYIGRYLSIHRTVALMPYFLLGCVMKERRFFPYAKSIQMKLVVLLAIIFLVGAAIFATQQGIPVEIWFQSDPYDTVYGEYSLYGGLFQLACYTWTSIAMVLFFALIPPPSTCGVQYYDAVETETADVQTTTPDEEEVDYSCSYLRRCYDSATRQRQRRQGHAKEKEQDALLARVYLRLAKWGQRSLYAYIIHMAALMLFTQIGYYNHLWEVDSAKDTHELANGWSTTRQVLGTVIMASVLTISLLLRPFFPTCLRCILEPNVEHILFQPKIEEDTSYSLDVHAKEERDGS